MKCNFVSNKKVDSTRTLLLFKCYAYINPSYILYTTRKHWTNKNVFMIIKYIHLSARCVEHFVSCLLTKCHTSPSFPTPLPFVTCHVILHKHTLAVHKQNSTSWVAFEILTLCFNDICEEKNNKDYRCAYFVWSKIKV